MDKLIQIPAEKDAAQLLARISPGGRGSTTILYLHGFGSSQDGEKAEFFRRRAEGAGLGFVSVDLQGHGRSGGSMRGLSLTRCLRDVERARQALPWLQRPVSLLGSSMGALVALWHAATAKSAREEVRSLILLAPALGLETTLSEALGTEGMEHWRREGVLEITNELGVFELGWEFVADLARFPSSRLALLHTTPTLIFQGMLDDRVSWREVAGFARATSGLTRLELFEDGDHRLLDRMDGIWTDSLAFLSDATSAVSST